MASTAPSPLAGSLQKTNGAKLSRLLIDGGTTILRNVFDHHHPPANLAAGLNAKKSILGHLKHRRILNADQWDKLFPPGGAAPDSNTFDITLLFLLLTNICGLSPPLSGWHKMPPSSDTSLEANLARIKAYRNELYGHVTTTGIQTVAFNVKWQEVSAVLVSLGLSQSEVDRLKAEPSVEDYIDAVTEWMKSEEEIKPQLNELLQNQQDQHSTLKTTQKAVEEVRHTQEGDHKILMETCQAVGEMSKTQEENCSAAKQCLKDIKQNQGEAHKMQHAHSTLLEEIKESHQETISKLEVMCQSVNEVGESLQEVMRERCGDLKKRKELDQADEVLKTLVKSEFRGDIEYHAQKFQEGTREWIFTSVEKWLDDPSSSNRVMVISGNAGMGKTVISAVLSQRMQEAGRLLGSHFCQHNNARYRNPQLMLQSLASHLSHSMPEYKNALVEQLSRNLGKDVNGMGIEELFALLFKEPLNALTDPGRNFLLVIDGLDESEYQGRNELLDVIGGQFCKLPVWIRFLVTTRPERSIVTALKHLNPFQLEQNQEENLKDIQILFEMKLTQQIRDEDKSALLKELVRKSEGLFLYAHFLIDFIQRNVSFLNLEQLESTLPEGISSVYLSYFARLEKELRNELKVEEEHILRFLCAITASQEPLPIEFVCRLLSPSGRSLTAQRRINKAVACISALLPIRDGCIHFFHKSVKDWLTDASCYGQHDFTVDEKEGHEILFNLCTTELENVQQKGVHEATQFSSTEKYALQHGVQHMLEMPDWGHNLVTSNRKEDLVDQYVTDLELIYAKLCVNSTVASEDLICTLKQVKAGMLSGQSHSVLNSLLVFLRKHSYILRDYPHLFFQCLLNEGSPELSPKAAKTLELHLPGIPYMEYVDKKAHRKADQARFYCSDTVACFDVSPEMDYLVCECRDGTIYLWSLETGNKEWVRPSLTKRTFYDGSPPHTAYRRVKNSLSFYRCVVFHPSGKSILPGTLQQVYTLNGELKDLFPDSFCSFSNCAYAGDKKKILTDCVAESKTLILWNMESGERLICLSLIEDISSFAISHDGSLIAFSDLTGCVFLFNAVWRVYRQLIGQHKNVVCGLMHFTSDNNTIVCGLLSLTLEEVMPRSYQYFFSSDPELVFLTPVKDMFQSTALPYLHPRIPQSFVLWPSATRKLTQRDFLVQAAWDKTIRRVVPSLSAGGYIMLSDKNVMIGSPACNYLTILNTGLLGELLSDPVLPGKRVDKVVFSVEGDTIYSIVGPVGPDAVSGEVEITIWRMSSREIITKQTLSGLMFLIPASKGVVIVKKFKVTELWNFELLSEHLPNFKALI